MIHKILRRLVCQKTAVYDENFFGAQWFREWEKLREVLFALICCEPRWRSILDFGCGPGAMIDYMNARGIHYVGCDYSEEARSLYLAHYGAHPEHYASRLGDVDIGSFDLFLSFDVFEHMTDVQIVDVLEASKGISEYFLNISRDWRTPGHINIKSDRAWLKFFKRHGLLLLEDTTTRLRERYTVLRPGCPDRWERNMFVLKRSRA
jgi:cyclopropane fatty-acyl-phospholipid synthase-like methyltransferase